MCGITGILRRDSSDSDLESRLFKQMDCLVQRGPDAFGSFVEEQIALGHRRLSIIDLTTGDQPMYSIDKSVVLVFNGEVYNFQSLRQELQSMGRNFLTTSDTEVVIQAYEEWGMDQALNRLEGMFAFALYDKKAQEVFLARDRYGEKPLYYTLDDKELRFASELKAIKDKTKKDIDEIGLNFFLTLSYIPAPYTIYKGIKKLEQGSYLKFDLSGTVSQFYFNDLQKEVEKCHRESDFEKAQEKLYSLLTKSVKERMVSDVPVGAFLSGGIDSSIIACIMDQISDSPINTFSIGFEEKEYDESIRAQLVANHINSNHTSHKIDYKDVVQWIDDIIDYFDEPFGDSSAIPSYYVAKLASKDVKVVLTGDCADELFGGYEKYLGPYYVQKINKYPSFIRKVISVAINAVPHTRWTNSLLRRIKKVLSNLDQAPFDLHYNLMCLGFNDQERNDLLANHFTEVKNIVERSFNKHSGTDLEKGFYTDIKFVLEGDMLTKVDRVCMKNSLEARVPFLDSEIVKFSFSIPTSFKIKGRNKKYILKETFKNLLPKETLHYRKKGFGIPVDYWFKNQLKTQMEKLIDPGFLEGQGLFNSKYIQRLWNEHQSGKQNHKGKLWNLFVFQKWYKNHVQA